MLKYKWGILCFLFISITLAGCSGENPGKDEKSEKFQSDYMELFLAQPVKMEEGYFEIVDGLKRKIPIQRVMRRTEMRLWFFHIKGGY